MSDFDDELKSLFEAEATRIVVPPVDPSRVARRAGRVRVARSAGTGALALALILAGGAVLGGLLDKEVPTVDLLQPDRRPTDGEPSSDSPSPTPTATTTRPGAAPTVKPDLPIGPHGVLTTPSITPSGRYVAFFSYATHKAYVALEPGAIFVLDRKNDRFELVSVTTKGQPIPTDPYPDISADGRYVAFGRSGRVYVRDRTRNTTTPVSVSSSGKAARSGPPTQLLSMSDDARYVVFNGTADNLVDGDTNNAEDVFLHDLVTRQTRRVSVTSSGEQADGPSGDPEISADGRYVVFESAATNLAGGPLPDCSGSTCSQIYVHDRVSGETTLVSKSTAGALGDRGAHRPAMSDDGRFVVFDSASTNLSETPDTDDAGDVFVHDRQTGETKLISGGQAGDCENAHIAGDGAFVAFGVDESALVVHDVGAGTDRSLEKFSGGSVDFSSDNHLITYSTDERQLVVLNLVGGKRELFE